MCEEDIFDWSCHCQYVGEFIFLFSSSDVDKTFQRENVFFETVETQRYNKLDTLSERKKISFKGSALLLRNFGKNNLIQVILAPHVKIWFIIQLKQP